MTLYLYKTILQFSWKLQRQYILNSNSSCDRSGLVKQQLHNFTLKKMIR